MSESTKIASPTPISRAAVGGFGVAKGAVHQRSASEVERLGMGMGRLGFGQVGASKAAQVKKAPLGFGSVGPVKATEEGESEYVFEIASFHQYDLARLLSCYCKAPATGQLQSPVLQPFTVCLELYLCFT